MKNKLNKGEEILREKLNHLSFEYQESDWNELQDTLTNQKSGTSYSSLFKAAVGLILIVGAGFLINIYHQNSENETGISSNDPNEMKKSESKVINQNTDSSATKKLDSEVKEHSADKKELDQKLNQASITKDQNREVKEEKAREESQAVEIKNLEAKEQSLNQPQDAAVGKIDKRVIPNQAFSIKLQGKPCLDETIQLSSSPQPQERLGYSYLWEINEKEFQGEEIEYLIEQEGDLKIKMQLLNAGGEVIHSADQQLKVEDKISLDFSYKDQEDPFHDLEVLMEAQPEGLANYQWTVEEQGLEQKGEKTTFHFKHRGVYEVRLAHTSANGCVYEISKPVSVQENFDPYAPNAFTPDGDGINDFFLIESFSLRDDEFEINIFDHSGERVFYSQSPEEGWNGRKNNRGPLLPKTTYVWKVKIKNKEGLERLFMGRVKMKEF